MIRKMLSFTKIRHTLGEAGCLENIISSVLNILNFEIPVTYSDGVFHVGSWICCTGKRKIKISNFSPRMKQLIRKVGLK